MDKEIATKKLNVGDIVWAIERDKDGNPMEICRYVFLALSLDAVLVSLPVNHETDPGRVLRKHIEETCADGGGHVSVFPVEDIYLSRQAVVKAFLKEGLQEDLDCSDEEKELIAPEVGNTVWTVQWNADAYDYVITSGILLGEFRGFSILSPAHLPEDIAEIMEEQEEKTNEDLDVGLRVFRSEFVYLSLADAQELLENVKKSGSFSAFFGR